MRARLAWSAAWLGAIALLVLAVRWLAYALAAPSPLASTFQASAGGPRLIVVALVSLGLGALVSTAAVWLAAFAVSERHRLEPRRELPRLRLGRLAVRTVVLYAASSLSFALFESYLHWRAGIGFHGLSCLVGPVHRNAIPLLAALALVAAALAEGASHLVAWLRATVRSLVRVLLLANPLPWVWPPLPDAVPTLVPAISRARAPPLPA
jgi:hypothetical protein